MEEEKKNEKTREMRKKMNKKNLNIIINKNNFKVQLTSEYQTILGTSAKSILKTSNICIKAKNTENVLISEM